MEPKRRRDSFKDLLPEKAGALSKPEVYLQVQKGRGLEKQCVRKEGKWQTWGLKQKGWHEGGRQPLRQRELYQAWGLRPLKLISQSGVPKNSVVQDEDVSILLKNKTNKGKMAQSSSVFK